MRFSCASNWGALFILEDNVDVYRVSFVGHREMSDLRVAELELEKTVVDILRQKRFVELR